MKKLMFNPIAFATSAMVFFMLLHSNWSCGQAAATDVPTFTGVVGETSQPSNAGSVTCVNDGDINEKFYSTTACWGDAITFRFLIDNAYAIYDPVTYIYRWKLYEMNQTTLNYSLVNTFSLPGDLVLATGTLNSGGGAYNVSLEVVEIATNTSFYQPFYCKFFVFPSSSTPISATVLPTSNCNEVCLKFSGFKRSDFQCPGLGGVFPNEALIDWGDGSTEEHYNFLFGSNNVCHTFFQSNFYTIKYKIQDQCNRETYDEMGNLISQPRKGTNINIYVGAPKVLSINSALGATFCSSGTGSTLTPIVSGHIPGNVTYNWSTGATTQSISALQSGTYSVTVTDSKGCTGSASININVLQNCCVGNTSLSPSEPTITQQKLSTYKANHASLFNQAANGLWQFNPTVVPSTSIIAINGTVDIDIPFQFVNNTVRLNTDARLNIADGNNLLFKIDNSVLEPCGDMWDGIYLTGTTVGSGQSKLWVTNNSTLRGAKNAISADNNARVTLENSTFEQNNVSLFLTNYNVNTPQVFITNNDFKCVPNTLLSPYTSKTTAHALIISAANNINIGNYGPTRNRFTNLNNAILVLNSLNTAVRENYFEGIKDYNGSIANDASSGVAIHATAIFDNVSNFNIDINTLTSAVASTSNPTFVNCDRAIRLWNYAATIDNNSFQNTVYGVEAIQLQNGKHVTISNNILSNTRFGIHLTGFSYGQYNVAHNTIYTATPYIIFNPSGITSGQPYGILTENMLGSSEYDFITDNTLYEGINAIWMREVSKNTSIVENKVYLTNTTLPATTKTGINVVNGKKMFFDRNTITTTNPGALNMRNYGITMSGTKQYGLSCNTITGMNVGLNFVGNCQPLIPQSIRENNLALNYYGLKLSRIGADFGYIGTDVGSNTEAMNNNFVGPFTSGFQTYNSTNSIGGASFKPIFWDHPNATIDLPSYNPTVNNSNVLGMEITELKTTSTAYHFNWCGLSNGLVAPGGGTINADELAKLKAVAEEEVTYPAFEDAGKWMDEKALYEKLDKEAALKAEAAEFDAFYDEKSGEDLGAIREAEAKAEEIAATEISDQALYDLKMTEWNDKIVQIPTSNVYAEKTRFVYSIAKKLYETQPQQLEESEVQNVNWLSEQCPYLFGPAVYKARVLRGLWEDGIDYNDKVICQTQGYFKTDYGTATDEDLPAKTVQVGEADLLRNPVAATAPFKFSLPESSTATLQIYNNMGQLVKTENYTFNTALVNLDVQALATGLYHLRFTGSNGFVKSIDFIKK